MLSRFPSSGCSLQFGRGFAPRAIPNRGASTKILCQPLPPIKPSGRTNECRLSLWFPARSLASLGPSAFPLLPSYLSTTVESRRVELLLPPAGPLPSDAFSFPDVGALSLSYYASRFPPPSRTIALLFRGAKMIPVRFIRAKEMAR